MGRYIAKDGNGTTLAGSISNSPAVNSVTLTDASDIPVVNHGGSGSDWSYITFFDASGNRETVKVSRHDNGTNNVSIVRGTAAGIEGITDADCRSWASGTTGVACRFIAQVSNDAFAATIQAGIDAAAAAADAATVNAHITDSTDAHDASAISFSPSGGISATDVQAAIAELDGEAMKRDGSVVMTGNLQMGAGMKVVFEGTTDNDFETTIEPGDPTADRTLTLPNKTGTIATTEDVQLAVPTGSIFQFPSNVAPSGFIKANGALISRTTYAALWSFAQASGNLAASDGVWQAGQFSPGDGSTTFRIPDLRGEFIRGWDDGRGVDAGRSIGSAQGDELKSHTHTMSAAVSQTTPPGSATLPWPASPSTFTTNATGGSETRPRNIALLICIKH